MPKDLHRIHLRAGSPARGGQRPPRVSNIILALVMATALLILLAQTLTGWLASA